MLTIAFLADHLDAIPTLASWFRGQWPDYYAGWSQVELEGDFLEDASRDRLPCRLVAFESDELVGTIILRDNGNEMSPEFQPELGGLYVVESHRGRGIGTELIRAGMKLAFDQGYEVFHATTVVAAGILERLGWQFIKTVVHSDGRLSLYRYTRMKLPDYWLTRPTETFGKEAEIAFDELLDTTLGISGCPEIQYTLPYPKWQFLCHIADRHDIALHGSGNPSIRAFEPRQSSDLNEFGNQKAVYAASDGLWAMFFAVVDRERVTSITNACVSLDDSSGNVHGPYYVFSVSRTALPNQPWRTGTVYLLPRNTFITQPTMEFGPYQVHFAQLASLVPVQPLAKLTVTQKDFPFLAQIRAHDDERLQEYATALQTGAPWPNDS